MYAKKYEYEQICAPFVPYYTLSISLIHTKPLPIPCYLSSLSPSNPAHMCAGLGSSTIAGKSTCGHILNKTDYLSLRSSLQPISPQCGVKPRDQSSSVLGQDLDLTSSHARNSGRHELMIVPAVPQQQNRISQFYSLFSSSQSSYLLLRSVALVLVIQMPCLELSTEPFILSTLNHCDSPPLMSVYLKKNLSDSR